MKVYVVLYHRSTEEEDETDVLGVYSAREQAQEEMKVFMDDVHTIQLGYYGKDKFDSDFSTSEKDYISFGFYGYGMSPDCVWVGRVEEHILE